MVQIDGGGDGTADVSDDSTDMQTTESVDADGVDGPTPVADLDGADLVTSPQPEPTSAVEPQTDVTDSRSRTTARPAQNGQAAPEPTPDIQQRVEATEGDGPAPSRSQTTARPDQGVAPSGGVDTSPADQPTDAGQVQQPPNLTDAQRAELGRRQAAASRERARERGDLSADAQDDGMASGPGIESGRFAIGAEELRSRFEAARRRAQEEVRTALEGIGTFEEVAERRQAGQEARQAAAGRLSGAMSAASAQPSRQQQLERETGELSSFVEDVEEILGGIGETGAFASQFGVEAADEVSLPGEGPVVDADTLDQDFGQFGGQLGRDVESALQGLQTDIFEATELGEPGAFASQFGPEAAAAVERQRAEGFTRAERQRQAFAGGAAQGIARTPAFLVGGGLLAKNALDLGADVSGEIARGDAEALRATGEGLLGATATTGALAASQALEEPFETAGQAAGSLVGTGLLFGAASAAGRTPGLATRAAIQPGEEILGFGGNRLTRALAGERRAQQLFPDNEPLIFSEEAAIRTGRRVSQRVRQRLGGGETELETTDPFLPGNRPELLTGEQVDEAMGVSGPSRVSVARGRARRRVSGVASDIQDYFDSLSVRTRVGSGPFGAVEVERETGAEPDFDQEFDPSRSEVLGGGASEQMREEMVGRQKEARRMLGGEFEGEQEPFATRQETRQRVEQPTTRPETAQEARQRVETALQLGLGQPAAVGTGALQSPFEDIDTALDPLTDTRPDTDIEPRQDTRQDTDTDQEFRFETEGEGEGETEGEPFRELERELEGETRRETRREAETEFFGEEEDEERDRFPFLFGFQTGTFASGIEDVTQAELDALFGGDDRSGRDPLADLDGAAPDGSGGGFDDLAEEFDREFYGENQ